MILRCCSFFVCIKIGSIVFFFFFSSRRRHTRCGRDWSSDVCSSDLAMIRTLLSFGRFDFEYLIPELNRRVMETAKGEKFITFFIAHYNLNTRQLKYRSEERRVGKECRSRRWR